MHGSRDPVPAEAFFLRPGPDQRYAVFYPPATSACRGAVLYVHPFGDEMNKSRRMVALQARRLAALGYGVLQLDLHGCGDSAGDFADARWEHWRDDIGAGHAWLRERLDAPLTLWGLRLGALLALDYAASAAKAGPVDRLLLWQPVPQGAAFLKQFLRLLTANDMLTGAGAGSATPPADRLAAGATLEVAGYALAPALAAGLAACDASALAPVGSTVHWFETNTAADRPPGPALLRLADAWRAAGVALELHSVVCAPFWSTQEITECPALLDATTAALARDVP